MKKNAGFTLTELMITLAIVGILLMVGVPSLKTFMQGNQLIASSNELVSALHVARSEAIKLNSRVSICSSSDGSTCSGSDSWKEGWIVFVDFDGLLDGTGAACTATDTDCLLRSYTGPANAQLQIAGINPDGNAVSAFTFTSRGLPKELSGAPQSGIFNICTLDDGGSTVDSRAVILSLSGRVRVSGNSAVITQCP